MDKLSSILPPHHGGYLPLFILYDSVSAAIHTVVCYLSSPTASLRQFSGPNAPPPHPLLAHVYGVKNFYTSVIRLYAAYNITDPHLYDLAFWSFVGVLFLYITEVFVYKNARLQEASFPYVLAGSGVVWMVLQRDWYLSQ
ncbi:ergosterol biosynthesis protein-like protein Erg28 [Hypomontagnella submonticulosa]|nr:ergosterol biosynthesis protein-like protein Erg28 [Hypomontagnella submonticulosa]